jgi:hypothetical protein
MLKLLEKYGPVFAPEDGGGGAGAGAGAAGAAGAGAGNSSSAAAAGAGDDKGAAGAGTAAAAASGPAAAAGAAAPYRPDGLPDTMFGKSDQETIDKMHTALKGYRDRDAARTVPDKPEAYTTFELDKLPEAVRGHIGSLAKDPLFTEVAKVAMEEKIPVATMQKLTATLYAKAAEAGVLEPLVDVAAERQALLPAEAQYLSKADQDKAIDTRMQANEDFVKLLTQPGADGKAALDKKDADHALLMLMDSAAGNRFIEAFRNLATGAGRASPLPGGTTSGSGASARDALRAKLAAPEMQVGHPKFDRAAYEALNEEYKRVVGN